MDTPPFHVRLEPAAIPADAPGFYGIYREDLEKWFSPTLSGDGVGMGWTTNPNTTWCVKAAEAGDAFQMAEQLRELGVSCDVRRLPVRNIIRGSR